MSEAKGDEKGARDPGLTARIRSAMLPSHRARRVLARGGIAALIVAALVIGPGYYASRPGFMARYPGLEVQMRTLSASKHKDVACQSCHVPPYAPAGAAYAARMLGEFYLSLVSTARTPDVFAKPTNASCQVCHSTLVTTSPSGDLIIPHKAHVEILRLECVRCHEFLVHDLSPKGTHTPPMSACLTCHDGTQAKNACVTCHTAKAAPDTHKASDWLVVHPDRQAEADCAGCHGWTTDWCADCHSRRPPSHVADWRATHPLAVVAHRDCESCHVAGFCVRCHGVVPQRNFDPSVRIVE